MPLKIVLADGNVTAQNTGKKILAAAGYDVVTVSNGLVAMKKIAEVRPDIVLLDVYLAGHSGAEICKRIRATAEMARIPILLTVGNMEPFCAGEAIKVKADGLIIKPFEVKNLITVVGKLAESLHPPQLGGAPIAESGASKGVAAAGQARRKQRSPESPVAEIAVHPQLTPEPSPAYRSALAAQGNSDPPTFSRQDGGQICDVCGHVNREDAFACEHCDVPLPRAVTVVMEAPGDRLSAPSDEF